MFQEFQIILVWVVVHHNYLNIKMKATFCWIVWILLFASNPNLLKMCHPQLCNWNSKITIINFCQRKLTFHVIQPLMTMRSICVFAHSPKCIGVLICSLHRFCKCLRFTFDWSFFILWVLEIFFVLLVVVCVNHYPL
jgi:hypothetical protein